MKNDVIFINVLSYAPFTQLHKVNCRINGSLYCFYDKLERKKQVEESI